MLGLQEISDRLEIQQLLVDYASAIDQKRFDDLDAIFMPDAHIDYSAIGGLAGQYDEVKAWLQATLAMFPNYQHMLGNMSLKIVGDSATGRTMCFNPMEMVLPDGSTQVMFVGIWYVDKFVRTPQGWRISERVEEKCYMHNMPGMLQPA